VISVADLPDMLAPTLVSRTGAAVTTKRQTALDLAQKWTSMWNGDLALVDEILATDFTIEFGAVIANPDPRGHHPAAADPAHLPPRSGGSPA
jgi:hypothetical protein